MGTWKRPQVVTGAHSCTHVICPVSVSTTTELVVHKLCTHEHERTKLLQHPMTPPVWAWELIQLCPHLLSRMGPDNGATERDCCKKSSSLGIMVSWKEQGQDSRLMCVQVDVYVLHLPGPSLPSLPNYMGQKTSQYITKAMASKL